MLKKIFSPVKIIFVIAIASSAVLLLLTLFENTANRSTGSVLAAPDHSLTSELKTTTSSTLPDLFYPYLTLNDSGVAVRIADMDNDGANEIVFAHEADGITIWKQIDEQLIQTEIISLTASRIEGMDVGDFDNNGELDIAISSFNDDSMKVIYQNNGSFDQIVSHSVPGGPYAIGAGDLNNDGLTDIAVKGWNSSSLFVYTQTITGELSLATYPAPQAGWDELEIGDVNGDDLLDVVFMAGQGYANPNLSVYLQDPSDGTLQTPAVPYDYGDENASAISILDYNDDGLKDVAMACCGNGAKVIIWEQQSDGSLSNTVTYDAYDSPNTAISADIDGNGSDDLALLHVGWLAASVWYQQEGGGFDGYRLHDLPYTTPTTSQAMALGDINGDTCPDLVVAEPALLVLYHHCLPISKHVNQDPVYTGEIITYTIAITNYAPETISDVVVIDQLPAEIEYLSSDPVCSLNDPEQLTCGPFSLDNSSNLNILISAVSKLPGSAKNIALVDQPSYTGPFAREAVVEHSIIGRTYLPAIFRFVCPGFFDDFSNPASGWEVSEDEYVRSEYLDGEYRILTKISGYFYLYTAPTCARENYIADVDARWVGTPGNSYGLIFGVDADFNNFYLFDVNTDYTEFRFLRAGPDGWHVIVPATYSSAINGGNASNHLRITRNGYLIILEVNGVILGTWSDSSITGPTYAGVVSSPYTDYPGSDARFDNFSVYNLPAGSGTVQNEIGSVITVSPEHRFFIRADDEMWTKPGE